MTLGPVMVDVRGLELQPEERDMLQHPAVGGVILFSRNYASPEQVRALAEQLHTVRQPPLLITVDQEGGRVQRFRDGFFQLPPPGRLGDLYNDDPEKGLHCATEAGWLMASEILSVRVDLSFAPVLDLDRGLSGVIGDRAFHRDPQVVTELALAYQHGMHAAGMASVGKHFPGHGGVTVDSHKGLPEDLSDFAELESRDMLPFQRLATSGMDGMMIAHVLYSAIDAQPAGFSTYWLRQVLRQRLGFQGSIFSDDLSMGGAEWAGDYPQRAALALQAGCDMVLVCNQPDRAAEVLESLTDHQDSDARRRLLRLCGKAFPEPGSLYKSARWQAAVRLLENIV